MEKILPFEGTRLEFAGDIILAIQGEDEEQTAVLEEAAEELEMHLGIHPPSLRFPFSWVNEDGNGGPPVDDPLTVDLTVDFGATSNPVWRFSLREAIQYEIKFFNGKWISPSGDVEMLQRYKAAMLESVADIDAAIAKLA